MADLVVIETEEWGGIYINDVLVIEGYDIRDLFIKFLLERAGHTIARHWVSTRDPFWDGKPPLPSDLPEEYK